MTAKLFRELSHPARLDILRAISMTPKTMEKIAEQIGASVEETSMHVDRLQSTGFIDLMTEAGYRASPLAQLTLTLLPSLDLVAANSDYFKEHELSLIPPKFVLRLGELIECEVAKGTVTNIQNAEKVVRGAEKNIAAMADEVMMDAVPVIREKLTRGVQFRFIVDQGFAAPPSFNITKPELWRQISKIPCALLLTEKNAMVFFLDRKLKVDYSVGFGSISTPFLKWCQDLMDHMWSAGRSVK